MVNKNIKMLEEKIKSNYEKGFEDDFNEIKYPKEELQRWLKVKEIIEKGIEEDSTCCIDDSNAINVLNELLADDEDNLMNEDILIDLSKIETNVLFEVLKRELTGDKYIELFWLMQNHIFSPEIQTIRDIFGECETEIK